MIVLVFKKIMVESDSRCGYFLDNGFFVIFGQIKLTVEYIRYDFEFIVYDK